MIPQIAGEDELAAANALNGDDRERHGDHGPGDRRRAAGARLAALGVRDQRGEFAVSALLVRAMRVRAGRST